MKTRLFLLFLALLISMHTHADDEWWGQASLYSRHFNTTEKFNERNYGAGIEYVFNQDNSIFAGQYRNSEYHNSNYMGYAFTPYGWQGLRAGIMVGLVNGYSGTQGNYILMSAFAVKTEWKNIGANLYLIPACDACETPVVVALQLRIRFR